MFKGEKGYFNSISIPVSKYPDQKKKGKKPSCAVEY